MGRTCPTMRMNAHSEFVHGCSSDCQVEMRNTDTLPLFNMLLGISFLISKSQRLYTVVWPAGPSRCFSCRANHLKSTISITTRACYGRRVGQGGIDASENRWHS